MENTYDPWRRSHNKVIAGVCGGIAEKLHIDPVVVRLVFLLLLIFAGGGFLLYIILWIVLPAAPYVFQNETKTAESTSGQYEQNEGATEESTIFTAKESPHSKNTQLILGVILIGLGVLSLVAAFIPRFNMYDLWPVALIVFGLFILKSGK